jgi:hypothetical protein
MWYNADSTSDQESQVLLAGFEQLSFDQLRNWMEFASELPVDSTTTTDPRFRQALNLLNAIHPELLMS